MIPQYHQTVNVQILWFSHTFFSSVCYLNQEQSHPPPTICLVSFNLPMPFYSCQVFVGKKSHVICPVKFPYLGFHELSPSYHLFFFFKQKIVLGLKRLKDSLVVPQLNYRSIGLEFRFSAVESTALYKWGTERAKVCRLTLGARCPVLMTLDLLPKLSESRFPHLKNKNNKFLLCP